MAEIEHVIKARYVVICDRCGCRRESEVYDGWWAGRDRHLDLLAAEGWRVYVSRSRRHYCPSCRPNPGHRMWLSLGDEAVGSDG